jgi:flagellar biosynthesis/type III secretory pathway protein FliH
LYNLRVILEKNQNLDAEDRELIMELSPLYLERLNEATQQGIERGIQQGIKRGIQQGESIVVENLLRVRFGVLDEELQSIVAPLLELPPQEFTLLLLQLSRDELLARFSR